MNNTKYYWIGGIVVVLLLGAFLFTRNSKPLGDEVTGSTATSTDSSLVSPYGVVTLKLGEVANFRGISIRPTAVKEDSRCAQGVQCVWEGTVKLEIESTLDTSGKRTDTLTLGKAQVIDTFAVSLVSVTPATKAGQKIKDADYKFTIQVNQNGGKPTENVDGFESKG